jgi:Tfp pilus assembly protein PilV
VKLNLIPTKIIKPSKFKKLKAEDGSTLVEVLVSVCLTAIVVIGIVVGILTMTNTNADLREQVVAKDIAASDIDYIMSRPYANTYNVPSPPANFTSTTNVIQTDTTEQKIVVTISLNNNVVFTLVDYRTNY